MRARACDGSRRFRWLIAFVLLVIVGLLVSSGCSRGQVEQDSPSEARRIAEAATVAGFVRTVVVDVSDGDNPPYASAFFIGPAPRPDAVAVVAVPSIQLNAIAPPPAPQSWEKPRSYLVAAKGQRQDGCKASVTFDSDPKPSVSHIRGEESISVLTAEQLDAVRNGTQVFIELSIGGCGW